MMLSPEQLRSLNLVSRSISKPSMPSEAARQITEDERNDLLLFSTYNNYKTQFLNHRIILFLTCLKNQIKTIVEINYCLWTTTIFPWLQDLTCTYCNFNWPISQNYLCTDFFRCFSGSAELQIGYHFIVKMSIILAAEEQYYIVKLPHHQKGG